MALEVNLKNPLVSTDESHKQDIETQNKCGQKYET